MASQSGKSPNESYAFLASLSIVQLEDLLKNEAQSETPNEEFLEAIEASILRLEKENPTGRLADVDNAWKEFQTHYLTEEGQGFELFESPVEDNIPPRRLKKITKRRVRRLLMIAAIMLLLVGLCIPQALGYRHIFDMMARWNRENFQFKIEGSGDTESIQHEATRNSSFEYDSIQDALTDNGIDAKVTPTWIPEGFKLQRVIVDEFPNNQQTIFNAYYLNQEGNCTLSVTIIQHSNQINDMIYEKDNGAVEQYISGENTHYILQNNGRTSVCWYVGDLECSIIGDISDTDARQMIDSIYER